MKKDNSDILIEHYDPSRLGEIIHLMKASLGESLMPKSESFFRWKHEQNYFGKSKILLATHQDRIVGLRTFMYWKWANAENELSAVRAVDTATDPAFQGKGIFRLLTMRAVEECIAEGTDLVFNTPNPVSKQGYLKMGWVESGRMPLSFGLGHILPRKFDEDFEADCMQQFSIREALKKLAQDSLPVSASKNYQTPLSIGYFSWRFADCPIIKYGMLTDGNQYGFIFRLKPVKGFIELRICEYWIRDNASSKKSAAKALKQLKNRVRPLLMTVAPVQTEHSIKLQIPGMWGPFRKGPFVTLRNLAKNDLSDFLQFSHWNPSIGSMELF